MSDELDQTQDGEELEAQDGAVEAEDAADEQVDGAEDEAGSTDAAGESTPEDAPSGDDQGVPAGFPAGLVVYAEDAGYSSNDIAEMVAEIGPERTAKFFQRIKAKVLADDAEPAPRQQAAAPQAPAKLSKKAEFALPPEVVKAFSDAVGGDDGLVKNGVAPLAQAINSHIQSVIEQVKQEILGQVSPVITSHQRAEQERMLTGIWDYVGKAYAGGYGKIFGTREKQSPMQKAVFDQFLGVANARAEKLQKAGKQFTPNSVMQYALDKMLEGEDAPVQPPAQAQAIKTMQTKLARRANQISVAPASGGGQAKAKPATPEQLRQSKVKRVTEVLERRK